MSEILESNFEMLPEETSELGVQAYSTSPGE